MNLAKVAHKKNTGEGLDEGTTVLIQNILERRNQRVNGSKPQTANPSLPSLRDVMRPNTISYNKHHIQSYPEEHFPPPRELIGIDYPLI